MSVGVIIYLTENRGGFSNQINGLIISSKYELWNNTKNQLNSIHDFFTVTILKKPNLLSIRAISTARICFRFTCRSLSSCKQQTVQFAAYTRSETIQYCREVLPMCYHK